LNISEAGVDENKKTSGCVAREAVENLSWRFWNFDFKILKNLELNNASRKKP
jgi:hypothetical protein